MQIVVLVSTFERLLQLFAPLQGKELPHGDLMPAECQQGGHSF